MKEIFFELVAFQKREKENEFVVPAFCNVINTQKIMC